MLWIYNCLDAASTLLWAMGIFTQQVQSIKGLCINDIIFGLINWLNPPPLITFDCFLASNTTNPPPKVTSFMDWTAPDDIDDYLFGGI